MSDVARPRRAIAMDGVPVQADQSPEPVAVQRLPPREPDRYGPQLVEQTQIQAAFDELSRIIAAPPRPRSFWRRVVSCVAETWRAGTHAIEAFIASLVSRPYTAIDPSTIDTGDTWCSGDDGPEQGADRSVWVWDFGCPADVERHAVALLDQVHADFQALRDLSQPEALDALVSQLQTANDALSAAAAANTPPDLIPSAAPFDGSGMDDQEPRP